MPPDDPLDLFFLNIDVVADAAPQHALRLRVESSERAVVEATVEVLRNEVSHCIAQQDYIGAEGAALRLEANAFALERAHAFERAQVSDRLTQRSFDRGLDPRPPTLDPPPSTPNPRRVLGCMRCIASGCWCLVSSLREAVDVS